MPETEEGVPFFVRLHFFARLQGKKRGDWTWHILRQKAI